MPIFGWDASHYDGTLTRAILARAKAEGIAFFHHKVAEGLADTEGAYDDTALAAARDAGIEFIGAYFVPRTLDSAAQVDFWKRELDVGEPWLYGWPGRYAVVDLERWSYDNVAADKGIDCAKRLRDRLGWQVLLYASHGQYGDQLTAWDGPFINADYVSAPAAGAAAMYPGDDWQPLHGTWRGGWASYSGKEPTFLQFTSAATIAGLTTCDADAFPGTVEQLRALITGDDMTPEQDQRIKDIYSIVRGSAFGLNADGTPFRDTLDGAIVPGNRQLGEALADVKPAAVTMSAADQQAIADLLKPLIPTAGQIADELAKRLGNG